MNRTILTVTGVLSASGLLLVDSAVKGTVLLVLAAVAAMILRRDSAATRHLVWLLAIVAMLVVPLLSAMLPQWRVLPAWASHSPKPAVVDVSPPAIVGPADVAVELPQIAKPVEVEQPSATAHQPPAAIPDSQPALATTQAAPAPTVRSWNWINALPLVWVVGFAVLILRLSAARWMLWNSERRATVVCGRVAPQLTSESRSDTATAQDPIVMAMEAICSQLGIGRPVTLLIHPDKTIPVVWGILRCRLMLPAAARQWSDEQLQSVLLHELAHIKRRDTIVQLLAQVACALHWFNPLVWFAAWRLDVERERSCDDLVLASGIRPSAYAGHLLDVVTGLSPARWTQSCGLAMARKSSLEGRLTAVLGKDLNRRGVSVALAGLALAVAVGIAVPIAMLRAADEWNPPHGAHIGSYEFSAFCIHDGKEATFVIAYQGDFDSTSRSSSNSKARTWTDSVTLTAKQPGIALSFHRTHTAPDKLSITTAPAEARDLSKPAPPPREFGQKEYDFAKGRVFLLSDNGSVRQLDIATPMVRDNESAMKLAALIAAIPPQERKDSAFMTSFTGKLAPETVAKLKWGEPVNGLRMALAYPPALGDGLLGKKPHFELVVQNVLEKEIHFLASDDAPNPRRMLIREGERIVQGLRDHLEVSPADWKLLPGECGVLRLFATEESNKAGTVPSSAIESDLSKIGRYHAIVQMEIAKAPPGAWTGKLVTGPTRGSADVAAAPAPMHKDARTLYEVWQRYARANGDIPGALVGELAASVKTFIRYNPTWETVPKLNELLPRLDATHDWKPADSIALLDEVAGIQDSPIKAAPWRGTKHTIRKGEALPKKFADATWGEAQPNGLRAAWVLEPGGVEHRVGAALKARLLVQNRGQVPVMLQVPTWHQGWVKASDAKGKEVEASGLEWTTLALLFPCRLAPGEYIEINTPGVGFGPCAGMGPWAGPRVGSNVLAKAGDELTLTHGLVPLDGSEVGVSEDDPHVSGPGWWLAHIKARLNRELPLPADAAERTRLLDRAVRELFATGPTAEETAAFVADKTPEALDELVKRLAARADLLSFSGKLPTAPVKFRVLDADANADKQPRVVLGPGEYPLSGVTGERGAATLKIVGRQIGDRPTNDAQILFEATEATGKLPPDPHKLEVPDGWGTWAIVCRPNSDFFYLLSKGTVRKIDYSNPRKVTDTPANDLPAEFRDEVKRILDIHEISAAQQAELFEKPAAPAATPDSKTGANAPAKDEAPLKPKHESAQSLLKSWQRYARSHGKIPGGLVAALADVVDWTLWTDGWLTPQGPDQAARLAALRFTHTRAKKAGPLAAPYVAKLTAVRSRMDGSHDWTPAEAVAMLDELTAITTEPVHLANRPFEFDESRKIRPGKPLPKELESAAWGKPAENGLRVAWLLEPVPALAWASILEHHYPLGTVLKARVLFHNAGKTPIFFQTEAMHQHDEHNARDAKGAAIKLSLLWMSGESRIASFRLAPGEYSEVTGGGIAIGSRAIHEKEFSVGSYFTAIEAVEGDEVRLSSNVEAIHGDWSRPGDPKDPLKFWKKTIAERIANEAPMPASVADRDQLIRRVTLDILGIVPTAEEIAAFTADNAPDALAKLTARLQAKPRVEPFSGNLPTGETKFRVIAADPDAAKAPRTANGPGHYVLGDGVHLGISQTTVNPLRGGDFVPFLQDKATIIFPDPKPEAARGHKPHEIALPNGSGTYGIVWERGAGALWVLQKDLARKYDFTDPWKVQETRFAEGGITNIPELTFTLAAAAPASETPKTPADSEPSPKAPEKEPYTAWGKEVGGLQAGLGFKAGEQRVYRHGETVTLVVRVRNVGQNDIKFKYYPTFLSENSPTVLDETGKRVSLRGNFLQIVKRDIPKEVNLAVGKEIELYERELRLAKGNEDAGELKTRDIFPTGKFLIQHEQVIGNSAQASDKLAPTLEKLATGKLELVVKEFPAKHDETLAADEQARRHKKQLQGSWQIVETHVGGTHAPRESSKEQVWTFVRDKLAFDFGDGDPMEMTYRIDEKQEPATIDLSPLGPREKGNLYKGIYELDGDQLKVHFTRNSAADSRPTEFKPSGIDRGMRYFVLKRAPKPDTPAEKEKEPFTEWGKEFGGLQAGLGFKAGGKQAYTHGEWATLVVRVRNVGKEEVKFQYLRQFFVEQPPTMFNEKGELKQLGRTTAFGIHSPVEVKLAAGTEIELYELKIYLGTGSEEGIPKYPYIFGTGKFQVQYEKVLGNSSSGSIKLDPALSKLATGKLELEIKPVAPKQPEAPKPKQGVQLERAMLEGTWAGEKDGVKVELNFLWKSEHQQVGWKLQTPDAGIGTQMSVVMELDGSAAKFVFRKGLEFEATLGRVTLGERGSLRLELIPNPNPDATKYPAVKDLVLTRQPNAEKQKPAGGAQLKSATEQKLKWGEPVNGLRMALAWPPSLGEPSMGDAEEFYLVVQNVSQAAVRLTTGTAAPNPRRLNLMRRLNPNDETILSSRTVDDVPVPGDWLLQPRESALIRLIHSDEKMKDGQTFSAVKEHIVSVQPQYSYAADMTIEKAPAGAWTGKLTTGETRGSADGPPPKSGVPLAEQTWPMPPWGAEKDGLSAGIRIIGEARIGGEVKAELWVRNSGAKDVTFSHCPRADFGLHVVSQDKDGKEHSADITQFLGYPVLTRLLLPAGNIVKLKEFTIKLGAKKVGERVTLDLPPGEYKLRAVWSDTTSRVAPEGEWTGKLTTGEVDFKLAAANASEDAGKPAAMPPGANIIKLPDAEYAKDGFLLDELAGEGVMWNGEESGLSLGYRITGDEWRILGKEVKVELWVRNAGKEDVKFQILRRTDEGLRVKLKGKDGKEHFARRVPSNVLLFGMKHLLSPGQCIKVNDFSVGLLPPEQNAQIGNELRFFVPPGWYQLVCEVKVPGFTATGGDRKQTVPGAGEWTGTITTRSLNVEVVAPDAPAPTPRIEHADVNLEKDGTLHLNRKKVTLDELKALAAQDAKKRFTIRADKDVPYAKVIEVMEALKAAGVTEFSFSVVAPDAPAPKPRIEHADVNLEKGGTLYLNRKKVTLDELKALAAQDEKKRFTIRADKDVPYAKVIEVVEALKAAGVTEFSFSEARVGDGKYRVANRTGIYEFDDKHGFSICRPSGHPQWFTVNWPAEGDRPACALRTFPNVSDKTDGKWAVVWEPGTDVLWWVDDSEVGKMTLTDPARVIVDRKGRTNNFSRDFGLPEEVKTEFRRLGFVIGRDKTPGVGKVAGNNTGGNSGEQTIVSAEFGWWCIEGTVTDADGKPLANVPVRVSTNQEVKTEKTDPKGNYRAYFSLPLQLLAHSRAVTVKPVLEGFTERDMAKSGKFNVLLRTGEEPQRVRLADDKDFQPGPIPRFAERDLLPSQLGAFPGKPGRADFVMLKTAK